MTAKTALRSLLLAALLFPALAASGQAQAAPASVPALATLQSDLPTITYRRVFEGSTPEFVEIAVRQDGVAKADVRQLNEPPAPQAFEVGAAISGQIFDLARDLRNFQNANLNVERRMAYLGKKTFRWEKGAESYETQFNYTMDPKASQLQKIFENLAQQQADLSTLDERLRYDRLGINEALDRFEDHINQRILPEPQRFLPVLDRIAEDNRVIEGARQRARSLAARIRVGQER